MDESRKNHLPPRTLVLIAVWGVTAAVTVAGLRMFDRTDDFVRDCQDMLDTGTPLQAIVGPFAASESAPDHQERCVLLIGPLGGDASVDGLSLILSPIRLPATRRP